MPFLSEDRPVFLQYSTCVPGRISRCSAKKPSEVGDERSKKNILFFERSGGGDSPPDSPPIAPPDSPPSFYFLIELNDCIKKELRGGR
jgi:hypothetical protein